MLANAVRSALLALCVLAMVEDCGMTRIFVCSFLLYFALNVATFCRRDGLWYNMEAA